MNKQQNNSNSPKKEDVHIQLCFILYFSAKKLSAISHETQMKSV